MLPPPHPQLQGLLPRRLTSGRRRISETLSSEQQRPPEAGDELGPRHRRSRVKDVSAASGPAGCLGSTEATFQNKNKPQTNKRRRKGQVRLHGRPGPRQSCWRPGLVPARRDLGAASGAAPRATQGRPPARAFSLGPGCLRRPRPRGWQTQRPPGPPTINEPSSKNDWRGRLRIDSPTLQRKQRGWRRGRGALGNRARMQLSSSKGLFCMRKHTGT